MKDADSIPTRQSLLARLKDWGNQESWREFFETYWRLIYMAALKAGLNESEAEDVVQEVMIAAAKKMPVFTYESGKDSLKGWLLSVTRWKVGDQFRKRASAGVTSRSPDRSPAAGGRASDAETPRTATSNGIRDPIDSDLEMVWDREWYAHLLRTALDRVKRRVNPAHYEIYHLHVVQGLSAHDTARALDVGTAAVHLAKHRVGRLVRRELRSLEARTAS
jgi:RNA polymerase sigma factor (sigma-70 family)